MSNLSMLVKLFKMSFAVNQMTRQYNVISCYTKKMLKIAFFSQQNVPTDLLTYHPIYLLYARFGYAGLIMLG